MFGDSWSGGQSFHNFIMHALCNSLHLHSTTYVSSWNTGQKSMLPFQVINETSVLALHSAAGKIAISTASNHAEPLESFQSVGITNVVGVKDAASDPHSMTGLIFIFHISFIQVKQVLSCGIYELNKVHSVKISEVPDGEEPEGTSHSTVSNSEDISCSKLPHQQLYS